MPIELDASAVAIGRGALRALHRTVLHGLGDEAPQRLQEAGSAGGAELYTCFQRWLLQHTGVDDPGALDAAALGTVLGDFFEALGWGRVSIDRLGNGGLALDAAEWAEAEPADGAAYPSCFLSAGLLAEFVGRLANRPVSVIEVECRSSSHPRCRFLLGTPEMIEAVYRAISEGQDYQSALST